MRYAKGRVYNRVRKVPVASARRTALVKKVNKIAKMVRANKPELKYAWDYNAPTINNGPTAGIFPYRSITVGTGDSGNRIGDDISVKKLTCKGYLYLPPTVGAQVFRCIAFIYKRNPDSITTSFSTIINLYLESSTMNSTQAVNAFTDWDNHSSFATLMDRTVSIENNTGTDFTKKFNFNLSIPKSYQKVEYSAGSIYPVQNELVIAFISNSDDVLSYTHQWRMSYTDA